jgi:4-amino-4-deoxy-L-arabinose transferase-like glycosyltransferase
MAEGMKGMGRIAAWLSDQSSHSDGAHNGWWLAGGVAAAALAVYVATLAPGLSLSNYGTDGGDLISAARTLGVPHPSGYPTYTLVAWLFTHLPVGVIAYRVNLLSAVCAAAAVALFFRSAERLLPPGKHRPLLAAAAALTLAFSSLLWSQAVISEVYALLMFFGALLLWLLIRWREGGGQGNLWLAALTLGLGLGNHLTLILVVPAAAIFLWSDRSRWLRIRALLPAGLLYGLGLSIYAYLPLAARHRPPVNWGNPQTWDGFLWVVTGEQYQVFAFGLQPAAMPARIAAWAQLLGDQFGWWGLGITLVGAWGWWRRDRRFALLGLVWMLLVVLYAFFYRTSDSHMYLMPVVLIMALWWGEGARLLLGQANRLRPRWQRLAPAALALLPLASLALHWGAVEPDDDWVAHTYAIRVLEAVEPGGLIVVRADGPTFTLWYALYAEEQRPDVAVVSGPLLAYVWYRDHIRHLYPQLIVTEPWDPDVTWDDLVHDLVLVNYHRPVYATDPPERWEEWFDFDSEEEEAVYRVRVKARG